MFCFGFAVETIRHRRTPRDSAPQTRWVVTAQSFGPRV